MEAWPREELAQRPERLRRRGNIFNDDRFVDSCSSTADGRDVACMELKGRLALGAWLDNSRC